MSQKRNRYVLLAVDSFSKFVVAKSVRSATTLGAAHFLVEEIVLKHGCIKELVTDRGSRFLGDKMQEVVKLPGIRHSMTFS